MIENICILVQSSGVAEGGAHGSAHAKSGSSAGVIRASSGIGFSGTNEFKNDYDMDIHVFSY